jgi:hypothetical protein
MWKPRSLPLDRDGNCSFTHLKCVKPGQDCEVVDGGQVLVSCQYRLWKEAREIAGREMPNHAAMSFRGGPGYEVGLEDGAGSARFDAVAVDRGTLQVIAFEIQAYNITGSHKTETANINEKDAAWKLCFSQIVEKGAYCHRAGIKFFWIMQTRMFEYMHSIAPFPYVEDGTLQFHLFDYERDTLRPANVFKTTYEAIVRCLLPKVAYGSDDRIRQNLIGRFFKGKGGLFPYDPNLFISSAPREEAPSSLNAQEAAQIERDIFANMPDD